MDNLCLKVENIVTKKTSAAEASESVIMREREKTTFIYRDFSHFGLDVFKGVYFRYVVCGKGLKYFGKTHLLGEGLSKFKSHKHNS